MPRNPFAWEIQVRREVLDDEMVRLRQLPYHLWQDVVKSPISKMVTARDEKPYRLRVTAEYTMDGSEDLRQTFIITRENTIRL